MDYGSGMGTCMGCGEVLEGTVLVATDSFGPADGGNGSTRVASAVDPHTAGMPMAAQSAPYRRENHLAELLKQATDTCPRIPLEDMEVIEEAFMEQYWRPTNGDTDAPYSLGASDIRGLIRALNDEAKIKKYSERWLQVKRYLCGEDLYDKYCNDEPLMPISLCERIHQRYCVFAAAFEVLKRDGHPLFVHRHNIPNLNTVICHLLYQDGMDNFHLYQWYFPSLDTIQSRLITECRIAHILKVLIQRPHLAGGFTWRYESMLTVDDERLFKENPERFHRILAQQIRLCQRQPRTSQGASPSPDSSSTPRPSTPTPSAPPRSRPTPPWPPHEPLELRQPPNSPSSTSPSTTDTPSSTWYCGSPPDGQWGPYSPLV